MPSPFDLADVLGPLRVIYVHEPRVDLAGILVVDNVAAGPSIGGVRMAEDVGLEECARLARAMTFKNAAAGLPHGGGKSVIMADPAAPIEEKEARIRAFAHSLRNEVDYIFGPDMGTDERCMGWVVDTIGSRAVGLPTELGGIPLDEIGATGFGVAIAIEVAKGAIDLSLPGARVAIQGFGAVGQHAARFLEERGARVIAVSDSRGATFSAEGLSIDALRAHKRGGAPVASFADGEALSRDTLLELECDVLIPAARPDAIHGGNVDSVRARLVAPGANVPATADAERRLYERGVLVLPDFIANAGGVICAAVEYAGGTASMAFATIEEKIRRNTEEVLRRAREEEVPLRAAAEAMARDRVERAMALRRPY